MATFIEVHEYLGGDSPRLVYINTDFIVRFYSPVEHEFTMILFSTDVMDDPSSTLLVCERPSLVRDLIHKAKRDKP